MTKTPNLTLKLIEDLDAAYAQATPGEWLACQLDREICSWGILTKPEPTTGIDTIADCDFQLASDNEANSRLITLLHNAYPALREAAMRGMKEKSDG